MVIRQQFQQEVTTWRRTLSLPHGQQAVLVAVAERPLGDRLKVSGVNSTAGNRVAALTHAGVVAQTPFVQVRVGEGVAAGNPFSLEVKHRRVEKSRQHVCRARKCPQLEQSLLFCQLVTFIPSEINKNIKYNNNNKTSVGVSELTGSKTSIRQSRCTASCVAPSDSM